jgi:hypothetical protein
MLLEPAFASAVGFGFRCSFQVSPGGVAVEDLLR